MLARVKSRRSALPPCNPLPTPGMPSLILDDGMLEIHYRDAGHGSRAIVLLHGFPFTSSLWEPQIAALSRAYRVIAPDLRGFGETGLQGSYSIDHLADHVAELLSTLGL